jgi:hypothetical protein
MAKRPKAKSARDALPPVAERNRNAAKAAGRSSDGPLMFSAAAMRQRTQALTPLDADDESWLSRIGGAALMLRDAPT